MLATTYPGVYIEENNVASLAVSSGATAVPVFATKNARRDAGAAVQRVDSWLDFLSSERAPGTSEPGQFNPADTLHCCLRTYFENGGGYCYLVEAGALVQQVPYLRDATLLVAAGQIISDAVNTLCVQGSGLFAILDAPQQLAARGGGTALRKAAAAGQADPPSRNSAAAKEEAGSTAVTAQVPATPSSSTPLQLLESLPSEYSAAYFPWLRAAWAVSKPVADASPVFYPIPPSAAVAGAYCASDRDRGVWKAPANIVLKGVEPMVGISDDLQSQFMERKRSVNMIRRFAGTGTVIFGARTRSADPAWRYIPVRRLFSRAEQDIKKAMSFAVFEPNTQPTWERVRAAISNYLHSLWEQGGLMGNTSEEAYFVQVGKDVTMTEADIAAGRMTVRIGMAAARPAEFIVLQFSQLVEQN